MEVNTAEKKLRPWILDGDAWNSSTAHNRPLTFGKWRTIWASTAGRHNNNTYKKKDLKQNNKIHIQIININNSHSIRVLFTAVWTWIIKNKLLRAWVANNLTCSTNLYCESLLASEIAKSGEYFKTNVLAAVSDSTNLTCVQQCAGKGVPAEYIDSLFVLQVLWFG